MKPISRIYKSEAQRFWGPGTNGGCGVATAHWVQGEFKASENQTILWIPESAWRSCRTVAKHTKPVLLHVGQRTKKVPTLMFTAYLRMPNTTPSSLTCSSSQNENCLLPPKTFWFNTSLWSSCYEPSPWRRCQENKNERNSRGPQPNRGDRCICNFSNVLSVVRDLQSGRQGDLTLSGFMRRISREQCLSWVLKDE